ncbi:hypothetical protein ILUMI_16122 [Ignelater luminosus]|uniref:Uncharacterized protein n=1 Tax=Ignelater luminosus TaxID=2038154 RepID=A0A8K0CRT7_IGNLU|nr:hypothetical protein ILUMI_16122 [Ignelater luminosus]
MKSSLEGILNISLSRDAWLQSSLPVKMGGLGIRYSVNMATPCFLALLSNSLSYLESSHAEEIPAGPVCYIQSVREAPMIQHTLFDLTISTSVAEDKVCLLAVYNIRFLVQCPTFSTCLEKPLEPLSLSNWEQTYVNHTDAPAEKDLSTRRDALNNDILQALRPAGVLCIREPAGCSRCDGKRPDGQTLVPWRRGRCLISNFFVWNL